MLFQVIFLLLLAAALPSGAPGLFHIYMLVFKFIQTQSETYISVRNSNSSPHSISSHSVHVGSKMFKVQSKNSCYKIMVQSKNKSAFQSIEAFFKLIALYFKRGLGKIFNVRLIQLTKFQHIQFYFSCLMATAVPSSVALTLLPDHLRATASFLTRQGQQTLYLLRLVLPLPHFFVVVRFYFQIPVVRINCTIYVRWKFDPELAESSRLGNT